VLITGETGTGKELIARAIHERSPRAQRPMVKLNCAAISAGLVESELFGHTKGAFTGATDKRVGRFELADGGTLFLDEVSELPLDTQVKLLRVLQEGEFEPVGSSKTIRVDVRVVAATNRDLPQMIAEGKFRADLYYRLNVFPIELLRLRARREDIPLLARHFLKRMARRLGKPLDDIEPESMALLINHDWPGNVRDLQNVIERAAILAKGPSIVVDRTQLGAARLPIEGRVQTPTPAPVPVSESQTLADVERTHIISVLRQTRGVIEGAAGAARVLNMKPSTVRYRMKKLGISREDYRG
jgi:formate hydrogenlyase transcriptional activator